MIWIREVSLRALRRTSEKTMIRMAGGKKHEGVALGWIAVLNFWQGTK